MIKKISDEMLDSKENFCQVKIFKHSQGKAKINSEAIKTSKKI